MSDALSYRSPRGDRAVEACTRERLRALVERHGIAGAADRLSASRDTLARAVAGAPVMRANREHLARHLDVAEGRVALDARRIEALRVEIATRGVGQTAERLSIDRATLFGAAAGLALATSDRERIEVVLDHPNR